jgi:WD40 repeat protein
MLASVSDDGTSRVWDAATGAAKWFAGGYTGAAGLAFSPDGETLAAATAGNRIRTWNTRTWTELAPFESTCRLTYAIVFSASGRVLVAGDRCPTLKIWDVATRAPRRTIAADQVFSIDVSADERFVAWVDHGDLQRNEWIPRAADLRTGVQVRQFAAERPFASVTFTPDGDLLTADGQTIILSDWSASKTRWSVDAYVLGRPVLLPEHRFAVHVGNDVQIRSTDTGGLLRTFTLPGCGLTLAASRDGRWLACGGERILGGLRLFNDPVVIVFSAKSGEIARTFSGHTQQIDALAFSPDGGWLASGARDESVRVWDVSRVVLHQ